MDGQSGNTTSLWMASARLPQFAALTAHVHADVCVIGAGIAGLTTAYFLRRAGKSVVVLDDGPIVSGETARTTAHLSCALDDRFCELERVHGELGAQLAAESHAAAIDVIERIVADEQIDCDFARVDGYLFNPPGEPVGLLQRELDAAHRAGLHDVEMVDRAPFIAFNSGLALLFPRQGQFHPLKYLAALANAIVRDGGQIFAHTHVQNIRGGADTRVEAHNGWTVHCGSIVVATNTPVNDRVAIHTRQAAYRSYVIGMAVPVGTVPSVLYWDTADPYHYARLQPANPTDPRPSRDILIVGGEDHRTGQAENPRERFDRLESWTRDRFPMVGDVRYRWSGQVMEPADGMAFIGRNPGDDSNVYIATGDSGHGMTHGTIAGLLLTDLIQGRSNPWTTLYDPSRTRPAAAKVYLRENANIFGQYLDWLTAGDAEKNTAIAPDGAAIVRHGLTKAAVYRDAAGHFHECSAVCPHLGGLVRWNDVEKTWDCPAHGSRFDCYGHILNGPANRDLEPMRAHTK
jgi:glycine/D-amino acid oxidase-like deaminating enzyme/nitrite reductase/ring-hydroxylating ferredoxin subunit